MITNLSIERFKSIRELSLACRRVNVFIGAPDTGKTNVLEALCFLSRLGWGRPIDQSLRLRQDLGLDVLFYRQFFDKPLRIALKLDSSKGGTVSGGLSVSAEIGGGDRDLSVTLVVERQSNSFALRFGSAHQEARLDWMRHYAYASSEHWQYSSGYHRGTEVVFPPHGDNLLYVARHNSEVYEFLKDMVSALDWKLRFDQAQRTFRLSDVREDEILEYNLDLLSDSLKRFFFYGAILLTSKDATLVMDEPDVFAFPPHPKTLGEMIGTDASNQFFLTTHNPYFLAGVIGKTPVEDLALFVCFRDDKGDTALRLLSSAEISRVIEQGASVFFNLDEFVGA